MFISSGSSLIEPYRAGNEIRISLLLAVVSRLYKRGPDCPIIFLGGNKIRVCHSYECSSKAYYFKSVQDINS